MAGTGTGLFHQIELQFCEVSGASVDIKLAIASAQVACFRVCFWDGCDGGRRKMRVFSIPVLWHQAQDLMETW